MSRSGQALFEEIEANKAGIRLMWDLTPEEVLSLVDVTIEKSRLVHDEVAKSVDNPTWETTLGLFTKDDSLTHVVESICTFPQHVSENKALRDACTTAEEKLSAFQVALVSYYA